MKYRNYLVGGLFVVMMWLFIGCEDTSDKHYADENWSNADLARGGQLYDKWWKVNNSAEPTDTWSLYPTNVGQKSGSTTWRCKECHGWDYIGKDGRYSSGSHYTGIAGVWDARNNDKTDIFDAIKDKGGDHDLSAKLSDDDVLDLTKFVVDGLVDMSLYITDGVATGDTLAGETLYTDNCSGCHGTEGETEPGGDTDFVGVGSLARENPQELLHKIRWGHPGTDMPSMVENGLTDDECGDILAYAQHVLPE